MAEIAILLEGAAGQDAAPREPLAAPPPNMIIVASRQQAVAVEEEARTREAALRAEHVAEVARLHQALRDLRVAHAAEIERLLREHAHELRRAVEAHWHKRNAVEVAVACTSEQEARAALEPPARLPARPLAARKWLARIRRRG